MKEQNSILLDKTNKEQVVDNLNELLSSMHVFYMNVRGYHWNIKGPRFFALHEKFEELYNQLAEEIDEVAERIVILEGKPLHALSEFLKLSDIKEDVDKSTPEETVHGVIQGLQSLLSKEREALKTAEKAGDEGTIDLISGFLSGHEKLVWMYSAFNHK